MRSLGLMLALALAGALAIIALLAMLTPESGPREMAPCERIGQRYGDLTCLEVWNPWEGDTGRGMWSTGTVDGKYRP